MKTKTISVDRKTQKKNHHNPIPCNTQKNLPLKTIKARVRNQTKKLFYLNIHKAKTTMHSKMKLTYKPSSFGAAHLTGPAGTAGTMILALLHVCGHSTTHLLHPAPDQPGPYATCCVSPHLYSARDTTYMAQWLKSLPALEILLFSNLINHNTWSARRSQHNPNNQMKASAH